MSLAAAAALVLASAATAAAAPNRSVGLDANHLASTWTSDAGTGFLLDSTVSNHAPCTQVLQSCDFTLIKVDDAGTLTVSSSSSDKTLADLDVFLYTSDATGAQGDLLGSGVTGTPSETVGTDVDPGYYLVKAAWMAGYGAYSGQATLTLPDPEEDGDF